ncbi:hypothetical protein DdX_18977 [Ditylenchus destructor]|uniref:Secreted protein n=1 Tax=Ditylenchus destructor TaxID=166010 RepID=A0AAD4MJP8_9BILA|nr:hypothetical protein DdX_18977 [Ditylenchus destructor]
MIFKVPTFLCFAVLVHLVRTNGYVWNGYKWQQYFPQGDDENKSYDILIRGKRTGWTNLFTRTVPRLAQNARVAGTRQVNTWSPLKALGIGGAGGFVAGKVTRK